MTSWYGEDAPHEDHLAYFVKEVQAVHDYWFARRKPTVTGQRR